VSNSENNSRTPVWIVIALIIGGIIFALNRSSSTSGNYKAGPSYKTGRFGYEGLPPPIYGGTPVRGYNRRDGTYVAPHYRSQQDSIKSNNWSYKGNVNPYTGKRGSRR